ncbi:MAG TPA: FAD-dependent oxidoreductase [Gammaproteobacteria bacterium]|nr:FAD-dependent oxidoreductase [Gammaproteobacteria bacterium]
MAATADEVTKNLTFRKYKDGDHVRKRWHDAIFVQDHSHKCPTYVLRTPPCQGSCPSGEDIRGWLQIARGVEKAPGDMSWQEYAFRRLTEANPFPSMMGRVCPAPCQTSCNRNKVDDFVGINAVEQFIGDTACSNNFQYPSAPVLSGKIVAVIGGGPAGLAAAYQLRRKGHAVVIFEMQEQLGGMFRSGIPDYRVPRGTLDQEIQRILNLGDIKVRTNTRVGKDVSIASLEQDFDAVVWALGCQTGRALPAAGNDAPNCITGLEFLEAYNKGRLKIGASKVVCIGGGDTSIDVVSVSRRLGSIPGLDAKLLPEEVIAGRVVHDETLVAQRQSADVTLTALFPQDKMTASEEEVSDALQEGVTILNEVMPLEVLKNDAGRAIGLKMARCTVDAKEIPHPIEGTEFTLEADLIVSAVGQLAAMEGLEAMANERRLINADRGYAVPDQEGHFVCGDVVRPHLLTTAIGQASIAADSVDRYLHQDANRKRPKVDVHRFDLAAKLQEVGLQPETCQAGATLGTDDAKFAIHNFEDRSANEIILADKLFLGHFKGQNRGLRHSDVPDSEQVLGHFDERLVGYDAQEAQTEAARCMSCGLCFECDNCVIYCPQDAIFRVKKDARTMGRYVDTDYNRCIGCHICADVCPTGYINMALGE